MSENTFNNTQSHNEGITQIKSIFYSCLKKWYWFVISIGVVLAAATFHLLKTTPVYTRTAKVLVKSDSKGSSSVSVSDFSDLGVVSSNVKINNELKTMQSIDVMIEVIKRLHLDLNYKQDGLFHPVVLYDKTLPIYVTLTDIPDNMSASFDIKIEKNTASLSNFVKNGKDVNGKVTATFGDTVKSPIGQLCVNKTEFFQNKKYDVIHVTRSGINSTARRYSGKTSIALAEKNTDVIVLTVEDINIKRADDILNMLIAVYNGNWLKDKNQITVSTSRFIDDRLQVIERELGNVDNDISSYKSENLLPDVQDVSHMYLNQNSEASARITELSNQISITRYIRNYLTNETGKNQLLPVNSGINNNHIEGQISAFNTMMLRRNGLVANSSEQNPIVLDLDEKLSALRNAIITSIDNQLATLNAQLASYQGAERMINARLAANPTQAKYLLSVERQQKVKESLYLFLLQKREENELSQAFTAYNTRVIEHPNGSSRPTKPRKSFILMMALLAGAALPLGIIILQEHLNTTVRGRKDLEMLTMPFIGEIPLAGDTKNIKQFLKESVNSMKKNGVGTKKESLDDVVIVKKGNRDVTNEAFRVLRTNLEFMTGDNLPNVIMLTSFNPGSGKSFITINLAIVLAIKEKKVLIIDGDMRHASMSAYFSSPKIGLANYLGRRTDDIHDVIFQCKEHPTLNYCPVGNIPPNPTELLEDERFGESINMLRKEYDYIFIDCPPVDIVADPQIVNKHVDRTIFVVRAGLLERSMVPEIEDLYKNHKFNNLSIILNGTTQLENRYGQGYKYGYSHYGYYHKDDDDK